MLRCLGQSRRGWKEKEKEKEAEKAFSFFLFSFFEIGSGANRVGAGAAPAAPGQNFLCLLNWGPEILGLVAGNYQMGPKSRDWDPNFCWQGLPKGGPEHTAEWHLWRPSGWQRP